MPNQTLSTPRKNHTPVLQLWWAKNLGLDFRFKRRAEGMPKRFHGFTGRLRSSCEGCLHTRSWLSTPSTLDLISLLGLSFRSRLGFRHGWPFDNLGRGLFGRGFGSRFCLCSGLPGFGILGSNLMSLSIISRFISVIRSSRGTSFPPLPGFVSVVQLVQAWDFSKVLEGKIGKLINLTVFRNLKLPPQEHLFQFCCFFPTWQVRIVRFYVSLPILPSFLLLPPPHFNCKL